MKNRAERGWFWVSLAVTLSVLMLLVGMAVVDVRCRQMGWGNHTPPFYLSTEIGDRTVAHVDLLGVKGEFDLTFVENLVEYVEEKLQNVIFVPAIGEKFTENGS